MSRKYSVDEVFDMLGRDVLGQTGNLIKSESVEVDGYLVYKDSWHKGYSYLSHFLIFKEKETRILGGIEHFIKRG